MWNCPIRPFLVRIGLSIEPFASHIRLSECFRAVRSQRDSSLLNSPSTIPTRLDVELLAPRFVPSAFRPRSNRFDTKFEAEISILFYIKRVILKIFTSESLRDFSSILLAFNNSSFSSLFRISIDSSLSM